jgi:hypothetical protein
MNTAIYQSLDNAIESLRTSTYALNKATQELHELVRNNGYVSLEPITKQTRDKYEEAEIKIDEFDYLVVFYPEPFLWGNEPDFEIHLLEVCKSHCKAGEYGKPLKKIHCNEEDKIKAEIYRYWTKDMPDNFYEDLGQNTDCPCE